MNRLPCQVQRQLLLFLSIVCLNLLIPESSQAGIETLQREFQARFHFATEGNYVSWPSCRSGIPAPLYPPDGFYGNVENDPAFFAYLVDDLASQFLGGYWNLYEFGESDRFDYYYGQPLYYQWLTTNSCAGQSTNPAQYDTPDFPKSGAGWNLNVVTPGNAAQCLAQLSAYIERLKYYTMSLVTVAPVDQYGTNYAAGSGVVTVTNTDMASHCNEAKGLANSDWHWYLNPITMSPVPPIGMRAYSSFATNTTEKAYNAVIDSTRGQYYCASTGPWGEGTVRLFIAATLGVDCDDVDPNNTHPPCTADGLFHQVWEFYSDGEHEYLGEIIGDEVATIGNNCPDIAGNPLRKGWKLLDTMIYGIITPTLNASADKVPLCGDGGTGPGSGGIGSGTGENSGGNCSSCQGCFGPGVVTATTGSLDVRVSLGPDNYGKSAGFLHLHADHPSDVMYTTANLSYYLSPHVRVYTTGSDLTSIVTSNVTASFSSTNSGYTIFFSNNATPSQFLSSVTISNNSNTNQMFITEIMGPGGSPKIFQYNYSSNSGVATWDLLQGAGLRTESLSTTWPTTTNRTDVITIKDGSGTVATVTTNKYRLFPRGETLVEQTLGTGSNAKTTTWTYYEDSSDTNNYGHLKQIIEPTGHWQKFSYDFAGRLTNSVAQFLDNATNSVDSSNRVTLISFNDASGIVTNIEKLVNIEVGRSYQISFAADAYGVQQMQTIRCAVTNAGIGHSANLTNIVWRATNTWETVQERHPDGTMTFYTYTTNSPSTGQKTTTIAIGIPNVGLTDISDGTITTNIVGRWGELLSTTVVDVKSALTVDQDTYVYSDDLKRAYTVTHLDTMTENFSYACCGLDTQTNRDGVLTQHIYDAAKRHIGSTQLGITTTNLLDADGSILQTLRVGSNGTVIRLSSAAYYDNGRMLRHTNALGGVTSYSDGLNGSGQTVMTNIYPNGGTRIATYRQDGSLLSITGTAVHAVQYIYGVDADGPYTTEVKVTDSGGTNEWVKTYTDMLGRTYKTVYAPGSATRLSTFNLIGQLTNQVDPDGVITLYAYNAKGEQVYSVLDSNRNYTIDLGGGNGKDTITFTTNDVVSSHSTTVRRTRSYVWPTFTTDSSNIVSMVESSVDGLRSWQTQYRDQATPVLSSNRTVYPSAGHRWVTNIAVNGSSLVQHFQNGLLVSSQSRDSGGSQVMLRTYGYDVHGRQNTVADARNGTTTSTFNDADMVVTITTPNPGTIGGSAQTRTTYYNSMLQATNVVYPDGAGVTNEYYLTGELKRNFGARIYPSGYSYDYAGRQKTITNWSKFPTTGARVTTWSYDQYRGWLTSKTYDGGVTGPSYTYTSAGRLATRVWARGITTTYSYNYAGSLSAISYSDSTPGTTYTYDRLGRNATTVCNGMTETMTYNDANQLLSETFTGGTLSGLALTNAYNAYLRRTAVALDTQPSTLVTFAYDTAGRLSAVTNGNYNAVYTYLANSPLVSQILFRSNSTTRMTTTKLYDLLDRLSSISNAPSGAGQIPISFVYTYNNANQRTRSTMADGSYWLYNYDILGQLRSGKKYWADQSSVAGQQFEYTHDDIGNRTQTKSGGDENSWNLRTATYGANSLNQYTNRDVPGYIDIIGNAFATSTVTVNALSAYRRGEYFRKESAVGNSSSALWTNIVVSAAGQTSVTGNVFVAKTQETFGYDADGNTTNDGRWAFTWDAENRLTQIESLSGAPVGSKRKVTWEFDVHGHRVRETTYDGSSGAYTITNDLKFLSDGFRQFVELNATNNSVVRSYGWGTDLSGSIDGAGGVGGLLIINSVASGAHFCAYDGGGNVVGLSSGTNGLNSASFDYDPFGTSIRSTGWMAKENVFRFSTKRVNDVADLILYEHRAYNPMTGRWLSTDPAGEQAGANLYGFVANDAIDHADLLGLVIICCKPQDYFSELGLVEGRDYKKQSKTSNYYVAIRGARSGEAGSLDTQIIWRMLLSRHAFKVKGLRPDQLRRHVQARHSIVMNALNANFIFGTGTHIGDMEAYKRDPQAYFNEINNGSTVMACQLLSEIIFQTGNRFIMPPGRRNYDGIWIPGDWGYIINKAAERNPGNWLVDDQGNLTGLGGENVFHTGNGLEVEPELEDYFWGHFISGKHSSEAEADWFKRIKNWVGNDRREKGVPEWRSWITHPMVGLEQ